MDSKLEAHIDEIFQDVPKTDKMVTMINRIKSKANAKYLQIRDQGYSRNVAYNEVDDWLMKAKVIVDEEAGKLTPAEIAAIPKKDDKPGTVVSAASMDTGAVVVEREDAPVEEAPAFGTVDMAYGAEPAYEAPVAPVAEPAVKEDAPVALEEALKPAKKEKAPKPAKKGKKKKGEPEVEEEELKVPVKSSGKVGKILGAISLVAGVALIIVAVLMLIGII